jgi:hypothetical protein
MAFPSDLSRGCTELGIEVVGAPIALKLSGGNCGPGDGGDLVSCGERGVRVLTLLLRTLAIGGTVGGGGAADTGLDLR